VQKKHTLSGKGGDSHCIRISLVALLIILKIERMTHINIPLLRVAVTSKDVAAKFVRTALRRRVMVSSARQAVSGLLASGGSVAAQYLGKKMAKAWRSRAG
jgi:hypothetical protein